MVRLLILTNILFSQNPNKYFIAMRLRPTFAPDTVDLRVSFWVLAAVAYMTATAHMHACTVSQTTNLAKLLFGNIAIEE
jgi:hypothetical protein